ncbi:decapping and exoribonuclease protein [Protopterus annectens]|uniref:decapping and exoribonuclease protein n=1 Tax=Protopterus annectens TaxID=7888 RepID=UPI001CFB764E|nr:decapping and exoribonuclease protein [Protopterus annectens]XP_043945586.1 decapping and exoribonuclease protein [Protopterus annectens]XP_043945587.1 decapping and exoribonuclease protein [Protopterus annectens]
MHPSSSDRQCSAKRKKVCEQSKTMSNENELMSNPKQKLVKVFSPAVLTVKEQFYDANFPFYKQPTELGYFSLDGDRQFFNDDRQLRYYVAPANGQCRKFNLLDGFRDRYIKRDETIKENLDHLLQWILQNRHLFEVPHGKDIHCSRRLNKDFVTWRGHLTKILTTPYENEEGWLMAVTLFNGTYYISEVETEMAKRKRETRTELLEEMMYMGYKFEQYMCADKPNGIPNTDGFVNTNEAFCTVIQAKLNNHLLLFSGEVDCKDPLYSNQSAPSCYVELKTSKEMHTPNQHRNFNRYKLIKWWAQSFLPGVPQIVAGYRSADSTVASIQMFETMKIFNLIRNERNLWKPAVCMNFCDAFLSFVKKVVIEDNPKLVHLFSWEPRKDVSYTVHRNSEFTFLPDWYVDEMKKLDY